MKTRIRIVIFVVLCICQGVFAGDTPGISHGPMLGAVSGHAARIWVRTTMPADVTCTLFEVDTASGQQIQKISTTSESDNTCIFSFNQLKRGSKYRYVVRGGTSKYQATFTTLDPSLTRKSVRLVYGYGYMPSQNKMEPGSSVFMEMALRNPDLSIFLGDFPYTSAGRKTEVRDGNKELRNVIGFKQLTSSRPTYAIYDDHDFGPNDCDGTHEYADEALAAFKEYWPNPSYGLPGNKGIHCSFAVGDVEFFLLDGRYQARENQNTMLGEDQFNWLCTGLQKSRSRYKVLVSGTQFGREKSDSWAGKPYLDERNRLFTFIFENGISGVIGISGDIHRSDVYKLPIGGKRFFYDFTPGALAREPRMPPKPLPVTMIHSYGNKNDNNMFGEIEFRPSSDKDVAIIFRSFSAKNGLVYEHKLSPDDLAIKKREDIQPSAVVDTDKVLPSKQGTSFALLADLRARGETWKNALENIRDMNANPDSEFAPAELIVAAGDMDPLVLRHEDFQQVFTNTDTRPLFLPVIGNHELDHIGVSFQYARDILIPAIPRAVHRKAASCDYYLDHRNVRIIAVDGYTELGQDGVINDEGRDWVEQVITDTPSSIDHIFISFHEPAFPRYRHLGDSFNEDPEKRNAFWQMLLKHKERVRAVMVGHTHFYSRIRVLDPAGKDANNPEVFPDEEGGIYQIDAGGPGSTGKRCAIVQIQTEGRDVMFRVLEADIGENKLFEEIDRWSITNHPPTAATNSFQDSAATNREGFYRVKVCR